MSTYPDEDEFEPTVALADEDDDDDADDLRHARTRSGGRAG